MSVDEAIPANNQAIVPFMTEEPLASANDRSMIAKLNAKIGLGIGASMLFAHGFGCDQNMWRSVAPAFDADFRTILFDLIGAGGSDLSAYDPDKYATLGGYAEDVSRWPVSLASRKAFSSAIRSAR